VNVIETTSENASTSAVRDTAEGSKNRTIAGTIKGLFRKVAKAITHDDAEPAPEPRRRRSGETEGEFRKLVRQITHHIAAAGATARGRYAALRPVKAAPAASITAVDPYIAAGLYLSDTLDWLQLWENNAGDDQCLDDSFSPQQDRSFPQP